MQTNDKITIVGIFFIFELKRNTKNVIVLNIMAINIIINAKYEIIFPKLFPLFKSIAFKISDLFIILPNKKNRKCNKKKTLFNYKSKTLILFENMSLKNNYIG